MSTHDCRPTELTFFERTVGDLAAFVADQDVIWVGGGSTANLDAAGPGRRTGLSARFGVSAL